MLNKRTTRRYLAVYFIAGATILSPLTVAAQSKQAPGAASSASGLKQTAYLKASTPHANDHFGNGGTLEGHGLALSGDGTTMAVGFFCYLINVFATVLRAARPALP